MKFQPLFLLLFSVQLLNAQNTIKVPQDATSISAAVQLAATGDTILLAPGTYTDSVHISHKHLIFKGDPNGGTVLSPGSNERSFIVDSAIVEFQHLIFDDFQLNSPPPNFAISANGSEIKVNKCEFYNFYSPIHVFSSDLEISHSIFRGNRGAGGILQNGGTFLTHNSLFYGMRKRVFSINRAHGYFFNNTLIASGLDAAKAMTINSDSITHVFNNIIDGFGIGIYLIASDSSELEALRIYNNNIYDRAAPYWYEFNEDLGLFFYRGPLIPNPGTGEISSPSNFVDSLNGDFTLQASSPCIDAGINAFPNTVPYDLSGRVRIVNGIPDIGAYETPNSLNINELIASNNFKIFPVPAKNYVWVDFLDLYSGILEIIDNTGALVQRQKIIKKEKVKIDLSLSSGVYFVRLSNAKSTQVERIVIE